MPDFQGFLTMMCVMVGLVFYEGASLGLALAWGGWWWLLPLAPAVLLLLTFAAAAAIDFALQRWCRRAERDDAG